MKLDEQQVAPHRIEVRLVQRESQRPGEHAEPFEVVQANFVLAVDALEPRLAGVGTAVILEIQLAVPHRQRLRLPRDIAHQFAGLLEAHRRQADLRAPVAHAPAGLDHLRRRPTAAVAPAEGQQRLDEPILLAVLRPCLLHVLDAEHRVVGQPGARGRGDEVRGRLAAVDPAPAERVVRETVELAPTDLAGHEAVHARQAQQLRQGGRVAEDVRQPEHAAVEVEFLLEIPLAVEKLAHQRFTGRHVGVHLYPGGAVGLPSAGRHLGFDLLEQVRRIALDPRVRLRAGLLEHPSVVFTQQGELRGEGAHALVVRLTDLPQPRQVDVRVPGADDRRHVVLGLELRQVLIEHALGSRQRSVKRLMARVALPRGRETAAGVLSEVQRFERRVQAAQQLLAHRRAGVEPVHDVQQHAQVVIQPVGGRVAPLQVERAHAMAAVAAGGEEHRADVVRLSRLEGKADRAMLLVDGAGPPAVDEHLTFRTGRIVVVLAVAQVAGFMAYMQFDDALRPVGGNRRLGAEPCPLLAAAPFPPGSDWPPVVRVVGRRRVEARLGWVQRHQPVHRGGRPQVHGLEEAEVFAKLGNAQLQVCGHRRGLLQAWGRSRL